MSDTYCFLANLKKLSIKIREALKIVLVELEHSITENSYPDNYIA